MKWFILKKEGGGEVGGGNKGDIDIVLRLGCAPTPINAACYAL
jgi:hypothetical protein